MKNAFPLLAALLLLSAFPVKAAPGPVVTTRGDLVVADGGHSDALAQNAVGPFVTLLKSHPHARRTRLSWFAFILMSGVSASVLYDRSRHTVALDYTYGGGDDPEHSGRALFSGVRDSTFDAILRAHPTGTGPDGDAETNRVAEAHPYDVSDWGGFQYLYLPRYGCQVHVPAARRTRRHRHSRRWGTSRSF